MRVSKYVWYASGGLANRRNFRRQMRSGAWHYYMSYA